jgi:hypothetical protein
MSKNRRPKQIAPRLANGDSRIGFGHGLPEEIKEGLRSIARQENKSMSWVMEEVIYDYFRFNRPEFKPRKGDNTNGNVKRRK